MQPSREIDTFAHAVIGAAIEVHRHLGAGFLESVYEEALAFEMAERDIPFVRQPEVQLTYKGHRVGVGRLDFLVGGGLILELKAVESLNPIHHAQALNYLRATGHPLALLINFNVTVLKDGIKRIILSR